MGRRRWRRNGSALWTLSSFWLYTVPTFMCAPLSPSLTLPLLLLSEGASGVTAMARAGEPEELPAAPPPPHLVPVQDLTS